MVSCGAQKELADTGADDRGFFVVHFFPATLIVLDLKLGGILSTLSKIKFRSYVSFFSSKL
jgi:hypothetical protein